MTQSRDLQYNDVIPSNGYGTGKLVVKLQEEGVVMPVKKGKAKGKSKGKGKKGKGKGKKKGQG